MVIIIPKFTKADIARMLGEKAIRIEQAILNALIRVGEQFVNDARSVDTYKDQTGNLRSSIGYVVLKNGRQIEGNFQTSRRNTRGNIVTGKSKRYGGQKGDEGTSAARSYISEVAARFNSGYVIIVVAGMSYAAAVEARGFDVLTNSSGPAVTRLKTLISEIALKIK